MSKRLLIMIHGEPVTSRALELDLTEAGYLVETAFDGEEAMRKLERATFDLLIAAEQPEEEMTRAFLSEFRRVQPAAKVVWMTTDDGRGKGGRTGACDARVKKPFDLEEFRSVVGQLLL